MVKGMDVFKSAFAAHVDKFILIGGSACDISLAGFGGFRATHDIDMLVVAERIDKAFATDFRRFISEGGYNCYESKDGARHFYRFLAPTNPTYPSQIELLSRTQLPHKPGLRYTPLKADTYLKSMSAIILTSEYYDFALANATLVDGISCLTRPALVVFKAAAYLNLKEEKANNPTRIRTSDITKHRNDVFRLISSISPDERVDLPESIRTRMAEFRASFPLSNVEAWDAITQSQGAFSDTPENYLSRFSGLFGM